MYLHGEFLDIHSRRVRVEILTGGSRTPDVEIGAEGSGVRWTADPVEITAESRDTLEPLLRRSATIRLDTRSFIPELYCPSCMEAVVNISREGETLFAGYVEPMSYTQPFTEAWEELEVNCIDALSALQYSKWRGIGGSGADYATACSEAGVMSVRDIISEVMGSVTAGLSIDGGAKPTVVYDGSRRTSATSPASDLLRVMEVSELLFMGEEEDETWTRQEVLEEILRYLNLHIRQEGFLFRIFSWGSVREEGHLPFYTVSSSSLHGEPERAVIPLTAANVADTEADITVGEVFNKVSLTCETTPLEDLVESPLDEDTMESPYSNRQLYLREYVTPAKEKDWDKIYRDKQDFVRVLKGEQTSGDSFRRDWFMRVYGHPRWKFRDGAGADILGDSGSGWHQERVPGKLRDAGGACLMAFGEVTKKQNLQDNSLTATIDMERALVVSVNGNCKDDATAFPNEESLKGSMPLAEYTGGTSAGVLSPSDDQTTNYIVISGKITLDPVMEATCSYSARPDSVEDMGSSETAMRKYPKLGDSRDGARMYCREWYKAETPTFPPESDAARNAGTDGLTPLTGDSPQLYEFKYSAIGDSTDTVSKVAALACMLVIGGKVCVETGTQGQVSDFTWKDYKPREECKDDDEYYAQCFTIGFDPKIGDKLLGTEFDIQNNIGYELGLDTEGTAIPIRRSDRLSGKVTFRILGPVNLTWGDITRRHPTWFRHTKWGADEVPLMSHVQNIFLKGFSMKVYSDNGSVNPEGEDSDLIYTSDTGEDFINEKDDITFRLDTALTAAERIALGVGGGVNLSTPRDSSTGAGLLGVYDMASGQTAKPEQLYVDEVWRELHRPRVELTIRVDDTDGNAGEYNRYTHPALPGRNFYVTGLSRNLVGGWAELKLKETGDD